MGLDRIGEVVDRINEGQAAGMFGTGFAAGPLARVEARDISRGLRISLILTI